MEDNHDFGTKFKDKLNCYFQPPCRIIPVNSASLNLVYIFVYLEKQCFYEIYSKENEEKKVLFSLLQMSRHFSLSHFLVLLKMQKTVLHKKLTCLQQNSEDMHRAGSPQMFLGMDFHRSQASTDHRKVLLCCVDKPVRHGKNLCIFS